MTGPLREVVETARMIVKAVERDGDHGFARQGFDERDGRANAGSAVHHQGPLTATHQPDVAGKERIDVRFPEPPDLMLVEFNAVPDVGNSLVQS